MSSHSTTLPSRNSSERRSRQSGCVAWEPLSRTSRATWRKPPPSETALRGRYHEANEYGVLQGDRRSHRDELVAAAGQKREAGRRGADRRLIDVGGAFELPANSS